MNTENKPSYYATIPAKVRYDKEISAVGRLLYGEITALCNSEGFCWATNGYFAELYDLSLRTISRLISQLHEKGYVRVEIVNDFERKIFITDPMTKMSSPTTKMSNPPRQKCPTPYDKNVQPPLDKNVYKNNTSINTTFNNTVNKKKKTLSPKSAQDSFEAEFDQFWKLYPRKTKKQNARESFIKARKTKKIPYETIEEGLYSYIRHLKQQGTEEQFITHASTWLNQARWQDEYLTFAPKKKKISNYMDLLDEFGGESENEYERDTTIIDHDTSYLPNS